MTAETNVETFERLIAAFNEGGVDAVLDFYADDIEIYDPDQAGDGTWRGHGGARQMLERMLTGTEQTVIRDFELIPSGDRVVALIHTYFRGDGGVPEVEVRDAHVLTFRDGKVVYWRLYTDPNEALTDVETTAQLSGCLAGLPEVHRQVVAMRVLEEVSGADAARALGLTPGHVAVLLHRARKQLFMALMTPRGIAQLLELTAAEWGRQLPRWEQRSKVVLFDELQQILCRAACRWAGVPLWEEEVGRRDDPWLLEPFYLRRSAAEDQWDTGRTPGVSDPR